MKEREIMRLIKSEVPTGTVAEKESSGLLAPWEEAARDTHGELDG